MDAIESICVIPNSDENFDEIWVVVNRANGRFVERMVKRLQERDCTEVLIYPEDQIHMDSTVSYLDGTLQTSSYQGNCP